MSKVRDKNRRARGNFVKAEDIAYWAPITHEEAIAINQARGRYEAQFEVPIAPFQMISRMIKAYKPDEQ